MTAKEKEEEREPSQEGARTKKKKKKSSPSHSHHKHHHDICLPPEGRTYLTIGQDLFSIQEYLQEQHNASLHWYMARIANNKEKLKREGNQSLSSSSSMYGSSRKFTSSMPVPLVDDGVPAAVMVYTDIQTLRGLDKPVDYGSGIEYANGALRLVSPPHSYLSVGLQVGLWLNGTQGCLDIIEGRLDDEIDEMVTYLGIKCPASKVFLRIGYGKWVTTQRLDPSLSASF
jgi:hypothetical protein